MLGIDSSTKIVHIGQMIGGLDIYIRNTISFIGEGYEFAIIHGSQDNSLPVEYNGTPVREYTTALQRKINIFQDIKAFFQVLKIVKKEHPDVIHCHSAKGGMIGRLVGYFTHVPTLYTPHGFSFLCSPSRWKNKVFLTIERLSKCGAYLLACGESELTLGIEEAKYRKEKALCWHNCVPDNDVLCARGEYLPYIVTVGRLCFQKNSNLLIDVINIVHRRLPDIKVKIMGVGFYSPDLDSVKKKIQKNGLEETIELIPWISHKDLIPIIKNSLLYFTVSRYEGLPLSVLEAMCLGKAIVATDVVGNRDCVSNEENGFLIKKGDTHGFADAVCRLIQDSDMRYKMEHNSRLIFSKEFDISINIPQLEAIYNGVAKLCHE